MSNGIKNDRISIIGTGSIGKALGTLLLKKGYEIVYGSRNPANGHNLPGIEHNQATVKTIGEAAAASDIIIIAVPYPALEDTIPAIAPWAAFKVIVDATNPFALSAEGRIISALGTEETAGSRMASLLPDSHVARAFTHVAHELLLNRGMSESGFWAMAIAADNPEAKQVAVQLVKDSGFVPVDLGTLAESFPLDPGGRLFPHMFTEGDLRANL
ncbi:NADPH-dependent F420 reductase (plasmid) [Enterobacter mori]|uniref:NADPH-dependent F420 reductase n=1 Tax=Enterobacter mori TaxID=539813 RepID=UPI003F5EFEAB